MELPEIRLLQAAIVLAEELNYSRAAERLHIEQSTLSRQILKLEETIRIQIFYAAVRMSHSPRQADAISKMRAASFSMPSAPCAMPRRFLAGRLRFLMWASLRTLIRIW